MSRIKAKCDAGHKFLIPDERMKEQASNCPECGLLTFNPTRPPRVKINAGLGGVRGDSDNWDPWCAHLSPMDPPRLAQAKLDGEVRKNPKTGCWEGFVPTRAQYAERCKRWGLTTDWGGQQPRENRREGRSEWIEEKASGKKSYFT